jgi:hypothetical protein
MLQRREDIPGYMTCIAKTFLKDEISFTFLLYFNFFSSLNMTIGIEYLIDRSFGLLLGIKQYC